MHTRMLRGLIYLPAQRKELLAETYELTLKGEERQLVLYGGVLVHGKFVQNSIIFSPVYTVFKLAARAEQIAFRRASCPKDSTV